jgi:cold-inducible RNA-binding protein
LYVGNLSFDATEADVKAIFEEFGDVNDVYMPMKDGSRRGFGFITMAAEAADQAMADLDGSDFFDRKLVVNEPLKAGEKPVKRNRKNKQCTSAIV